MNTCGSGHKTHDKILTETTIGNMWCFDADKYNNQAGIYCSGQDILSTTLIRQGSWEDHDTAVIRPLLLCGDKERLVIDFGCHIGWYTLMAAQMGYDVLAIEGDAENLRLLTDNLIYHGLTNKVEQRYLWIDENLKLDLDLDREVELLKADIEGNEQWAIKAVEPLLERGNIKNMYLEITPAFNDSYPALIKKIRGYGFSIYMPDGTPFNDNFDFSQINVLCVLK